MKCSDLKQLKLDESGKIGYTFKTLGSGFWALKQNDFRKAITKIVLQVDMLIVCQIILVFDISYFHNIVYFDIWYPLIYISEKVFEASVWTAFAKPFSWYNFADINRSKLCYTRVTQSFKWDNLYFFHVFYQRYHPSIYVYVSCNIRTFLPLDINFPETHSLYLFRGVLK